MTGRPDDLLYRERRDRVAVQVLYRWLGDDAAGRDDGAGARAVAAAADAAYRADLNDLDWEAATMRRLSTVNLDQRR